MRKKLLKKWLLAVCCLFLINTIAQYVTFRIDTTFDRRYTLSSTSKEIIKQIQKPLQITVFLNGDFPLSFKKIQSETMQLLQEYQNINPNISFSISDVMTNENKNNKAYIQKLVAKGIKPLQITVTEKGKTTKENIFPWAMVYCNGKEALIPLVKSTRAMSSEEMINTSVQNLEYELTNSIGKVISDKNKKIAVIKGIGEVSDVRIADLLLSLREDYYIAPFVIDSIANNPNKTLNQLYNFDVIYVNKPSKAFTDKQLQVLDQYIIKGGKAIFAIDEVSASVDSLQQKGEFMAFAKLSNLQDLFFKYGVRINPVLVKDELGTPMKVAIGKQGNQTQYENMVWKYAPYVFSNQNHPIVKNIEGVKFNFANTIDTLPNTISKTILLQSSLYSKTVGMPKNISLNMLNEQSTPSDYKGSGNHPLAVLLEGKFTSMFKNRILPFKQNDYIEESNESKIIVIADGDIGLNQLDTNNQPMELGYDKWTGKLYGNKEFMLNSFHYLLGSSKLLNLKSKEFVLPLLDKEKVSQNYTIIQLLVVLIPMLLLILFGGIYQKVRKNNYAVKKSNENISKSE